MKIEGTITAMVTPFDKDGAVDYGALKAFVDWQCENGVEGISWRTLPSTNWRKRSKRRTNSWLNRKSGNPGIRKKRNNPCMPS